MKFTGDLRVKHTFKVGDRVRLVDASSEVIYRKSLAYELYSCTVASQTLRRGVRQNVGAPQNYYMRYKLALHLYNLLGRIRYLLTTTAVRGF